MLQGCKGTAAHARTLTLRVYGQPYGPTCIPNNDTTKEKIDVLQTDQEHGNGGTPSGRLALEAVEQIVTTQVASSPPRKKLADLLIPTASQPVTAKLVSSTLPQKQIETRTAVVPAHSSEFISCRSDTTVVKELTLTTYAKSCVCGQDLLSYGAHPLETTKLCSEASCCTKAACNTGLLHPSSGSKPTGRSRRNYLPGSKMTRRHRRTYLTGLVFSLLILLRIIGSMSCAHANSLRTNSSIEATTSPIACTIRYRYFPRKSQHKGIWYDIRLEEKRDCIYRLPPPGNGRQTRIYEFYRSSDPIIQGERIHLLPKARTRDNHAILQWNAQSLDEEKALELSHFAKHHQASVLLVSELGHRRSIPGFNPVVSDDRFTQSGIFIPASLEARIIDCSSLEHDRIAIQAAIVDESFLIIHPYIPPDTAMSSRRIFWSRIAKFCTKHDNVPIVIAGDLNTRSPLFCANHSENHDYVAQAIDAADLMIQNTGEPTRGPNALDVALSNPLANSNITCWQPLDALASDHLPCLINTTFKASTKLNYESTYELLDISETLRKFETALLGRGEDGPVTLDQFVELLLSSRCYKSVTPKDNVSFWNDELTELAQQRNQLRRQYGRSPSDRTEAAYRSSHNRFRKAFRKAKREYQQELVLAAANDPTGAQGWSLLKQLAPGTRGKKTKIWVSHSTKAKALKNSKSKSAPGTDGISFALLKSCTSNPTILRAMLEAFNFCLTSYAFPERLKHAKVRALPKEKPGDFRPISLLPTIGKIYEKMLEKRLREEFPLNEAQFGCRPGHSTSHALARLLHASGTAAAAFEQFGCISFDFSKAYDRVPRNLLVKKLYDNNISPYLILAINDWLQNRTFHVSHRGSSSDTLAVHNGIPQGSSLSVMLWLVYINDITINKESANIFVDDTIVWAKGSSRRELRLRLTEEATKLMKWCSENKVQVNLDKTKMIFNEADPYDTDLRLRHYGNIPVSQHIRYLGVHLKSSPLLSNSSLVVDLEAVGADIRRRCSVLKQLRKYSIPQPLLERFIEGFVCGKLRYFTPILGAEARENSEILKPLKLAYKELMRTETGAVRTTPIPLLQAGTRRPSLLNMIASDTTNMVMSSVAYGNILGDEYVSWNGDYDGWTPLGKAWEMLRRVAPDYESVVPQTHIPRSVRDGMYKCNFRIPPTREEAIRLHSQNQLLIHSDIQLWTDGAFLASSEEGGAAYIITGRSLLDIHSSGLQQISSSYEAERAALRLGLLAIEKMECHNKHIAIYTDSQGLARQLESTPLSYKTAESPILECAEILSSPSDLNRITVCWIPSHLNIGLNDEVDVLAKHGLSARLAPAEAPLPRLNSFRLRLKRELTRITEEEIARSVKPSQFHAYPDRQPFIGTYQQGANGIRRWKPSPYTRKSRFERGIMFRVRSGHTRCQAHMHRIGIVETAAPCRLCEEETAESVEHFLFHCSALQQQLAAPLTGLLAVADAVPPDIYSLCWTRPREVRKLLKAAEQAGAWI